MKLLIILASLIVGQQTVHAQDFEAKKASLCPNGYILSGDSNKQKFCCIKERENHGGGEVACREVPGCKVEIISPYTVDTANNTNSKCRKTDKSGNIIPGNTCDGSWNIVKGKCCYMER